MVETGIHNEDVDLILKKIGRHHKWLSWLLLSSSVMSDFLQPHGLQHARLPCPSSAPCSNSCPLSWWCHPIISSSIVLFSYLQSFPASGSFPMSQFFASGSQSIGASASVLPVNIQGWFPLGLTGFNETKWKLWTLESKFCHCCCCGSCIGIVTFLN